MLKGVFNWEDNEGFDDQGRQLSSLYQQTTWGATCNQSIAQLVLQMSHTFPRTKILHICDGSAAQAVFGILDTVGGAYKAYTCANTSQDIVDNMRDKIGLETARERRLLFEVLHSEASSTAKEPYDVVIVADICRARQDIPESIR